MVVKPQRSNSVRSPTRLSIVGRPLLKISLILLPGPNSYRHGNGEILRIRIKNYDLQDYKDFDENYVAIVCATIIVPCVALLYCISLLSPYYVMKYISCSKLLTN